MENTNDTISISKKLYFHLLANTEMLNRLISGGVDDWQWYGESLYGDDVKDFDEWKENLRKEIFGS